jgi:hypothetical protein
MSPTGPAGAVARLGGLFTAPVAGPAGWGDPGSAASSSLWPGGRGRDSQAGLDMAGDFSPADD